jgi:hypothetical protein
VFHKNSGFSNCSVSASQLQKRSTIRAGNRREAVRSDPTPRGCLQLKFDDRCNFLISNAYNKTRSSCAIFNFTTWYVLTTDFEPPKNTLICYQSTFKIFTSRVKSSQYPSHFWKLFRACRLVASTPEGRDAARGPAFASGQPLNPQPRGHRHVFWTSILEER